MADDAGMRRQFNTPRQLVVPAASVVLGALLLACSAPTTSATPSTTPDAADPSSTTPPPTTHTVLPEAPLAATTFAPNQPDDATPLVPSATADRASQRSSCFESSLGILRLYDAANGTYLAFGVNPASPSYGRWSFAVEGVGVVWPETPTLPMDTSSDSLLKLSYSGPGEIDRQATTEFLRYGIFEFSGEEEPISIDIVGEIDLLAWTANVSVTFESSSHLIEPLNPPPQTAHVTLETIAEAYNSANYGALYDLFNSDLASSISRAEFISQVEQVAGGLSLTTRVVGDVEYTGCMGTPLAIGMIEARELTSGEVERSETILAFEGMEWRIMSTEPVGTER